MTVDQYVAQAAALRVAAAVRQAGHLFCHELPPMDVDYFLRMLGDAGLDLHPVSLALVGYGLSDGDLRNRLNNLGLPVGHASTDLHVAAAWRNNPEVHPSIIALAVGRHPGVSTLAHFPQGTARELAEMLLDWAQGASAGLVSTSRQQSLLDALAHTSELAPLISLSGVAAFLAAWKEARPGNELDAPRRALPRLGLLPDRNLLGADRSVTERLASNFALTRTLSSMAGSRLEAIRRRTKKDVDDARRTEVLDILHRVETLRRVGDAAAYGALEFEDAQRLVKPPKEEPPIGPSPAEEGSAESPPDDAVADVPPTRNGLGVSADGGSALIDGDDARLGEIVAGVEAALVDALDDDSEEAKGSYEVDGEELNFQIPVDRGFLTWTRAFCSADTWGGYYRTESTSLEEALKHYRQCEPVPFQPNAATIAHDGEVYDLRSVLSEMQAQLHRLGVTGEDYCALWDRIVAARGTVLASLDLLVQQPMLAVAGKRDLRDAVTELIRAWERFYGKLAEHHQAMHDFDHPWTRLLFEAVAALDVVQIETRLDSDTSFLESRPPPHASASSLALRADGRARPRAQAGGARSRCGAQRAGAPRALSRRPLPYELPCRSGGQPSAPRRARLPRSRRLRELQERL